jgi:hypothetical protein
MVSGVGGKTNGTFATRPAAAVLYAKGNMVCRRLFCVGKTEVVVDAAVA